MALPPPPAGWTRYAVKAKVVSVGRDVRVTGRVINLPKRMTITGPGPAIAMLWAVERDPG